MIALLTALPLPELAVLALVLGLPAAVALLFWPLLRRGSRVALAPEGPIIERTAALGLAGQWSVLAGSLQAMTARRSTAIALHERAARSLGAIDYEVDCLWRETRALGRALDAELPVNSIVKRARQVRWTAPTASRAGSQTSFRLAS